MMEIEIHPWQPFIPNNAKILIMGTFPPQPKRWSMNFYYPNRTNDFWYMMGIIFFGDKYALCTPDKKGFDLEAIKELLCRKGIAMNDTARKVHRIQGNASDKFLEIIEAVPLYELLSEMPDCKTLCTTGEKAAGVIAQLTNTSIPKMGEKVVSEDGMTIWRMPSTSRAYPVKLETKAEYYEKMFRASNVL
ncbi:MAG: uracil-DNA glycosylase family protein [Muribaculaceae bacterium]|nr:uracil-DNA glycosylase family protein [Muribaculaceae bacterium]MDE6753321.1 uracil-DNA glycosylase family protein [Muribaculaceae bacterium]